MASLSHLGPPSWTSPLSPKVKEKLIAKYSKIWLQRERKGHWFAMLFKKTKRTRIIYQNMQISFVLHVKIWLLWKYQMTWGDVRRVKILSRNAVTAIESLSITSKSLKLFWMLGEKCVVHAISIPLTFIDSWRIDHPLVTSITLDRLCDFQVPSHLR